MARRFSYRTLFVLTAVAFLVVVPMYANIREQWILASILRHNEEVFTRALDWSPKETTANSRSVLLVPVLPTENLDKKNNTSTLAAARSPLSAITSDKTLTSNSSTNSSAIYKSPLFPPPMLATDIADSVHDALADATITTKDVHGHGRGGTAALVKLANLSSVDYVACCGLGHRLSRMANAAWIAKSRNLTLRTYWGYCGDDTEVFQHLFGPPSTSTSTKSAARTTASTSSTNQHLRFVNEVQGFQPLIRRGGINQTSCTCHNKQIEAHFDFYKELRDRFRYKTYIDAFVNETFANHVVLGMHIRAGNGEKGDFEEKKRGIPYLGLWVQNAVQRIRELVQKEQWKDPPLLYIATDTPSLIDTFRQQLQNVMPVIEFPQERREEGDGVFFGERGKKTMLSDRQCIRQWEYAVADMILLSYAHVLIAGRLSSFEQTMPTSLVFGRSADQQQAIRSQKCEFNFDASRMVCSKTYMDWCCNVGGHHLHVPYIRESLMVPSQSTDLSFSSYELKERPHTKESKYAHLPYYWKPRTNY